MNERGFLRVFTTLVLSWLISVGAWLLLGGLHGGSHAVEVQGSTTRYVTSISGQDAGNCTSQAAPCRTIQYAVDRAQDGDAIHIATFEVAFSPSLGENITRTATYTSREENVIVLTKTLTLRGGYVYMPLSERWEPSPFPAPVNGEQLRRGIFVSGDVTVTLERLAFVNGQAERGGNVYVEGAQVTFHTTPVLSGTADYGGGLYLKDCHRTDFGVGVQESVNLADLSGLLPVRGNQADYGAGIYVDGGAPVLTGLDVAFNVAAKDGGGVYLAGGHPIVAAGVVWDNQAGDKGGGSYLRDSSARIAGMAVVSNTAPEGAG